MPALSFREDYIRPTCEPRGAYNHGEENQKEGNKKSTLCTRLVTQKLARGEKPLKQGEGGHRGQVQLFHFRLQLAKGAAHSKWEP